MLSHSNVAHQALLSLGILWAKLLEWVAISYSSGSSQLRDWTHVSCLSSWQVYSLPLSHRGSPYQSVTIANHSVGEERFTPLMLSVLWETSVCVCAMSLRSCPTLGDPMDFNLPGSSIHGDSPGKNTAVNFHAFLQDCYKLANIP